MRLHPWSRNLVSACFACILCCASAASAADIVVTTTSGSTGGPSCTLRDAVTAANHRHSDRRLPCRERHEHHHPNAGGYVHAL